MPSDQCRYYLCTLHVPAEIATDAVAIREWYYARANEAELRVAAGESARRGRLDCDRSLSGSVGRDQCPDQ